jgi:O-antigen ligase
VTLTFFRAAWLGAIVVLITAFGLRPRRAGRLVVVAGAVAITTLAIAAPLQGNTQFAARASNQSNVTARLATYLTSLRLFEHSPITGVGFGNFQSAITAAPSAVVAGQSAVPQPHSSYIFLLAEQGIIGFFPFLALNVVAWQAIRRYRRTAFSREDILLGACCAGAAIAYLIMSATLTILTEAPPNEFLAALLGVVCARLDFLASARPEVSPESS